VGRRRGDGGVVAVQQDGGDARVGQQGSGDQVGAGAGQLVVEVPGRQQVGRQDDALGARVAGRGDGVRHGRLGGRPVAGGHRPGPGALQEGGGVLDVGDRPLVAGPRGRHHDGGARVLRVGAGLDEPVQQHGGQSRVRPQRPRRDGALGVGHGARDVDVHVVAAGQQQRHHHGGTALGGQPGHDVDHGRRLDVDERRRRHQTGTELLRGERELGDEPAAGRVARAVGAGDQDGIGHSARVMPPSTAIIVPLR
jgi:hypothetical protein